MGRIIHKSTVDPVIKPKGGITGEYLVSLLMQIYADQEDAIIEYSIELKDEMGSAAETVSDDVWADLHE